MDPRIIICTCAAYILSISHHASATCQEHCSIQCPPSLLSTTSPFRRFWNRNEYSLCLRECSYVCEGQVLQIPSYVQRRRILSDNNKILVPFPFAVEFYDKNGDGRISYSEFAFTVKCNTTDPETRRAFDLADTDDDQFISRQELSVAPFSLCLSDDDDWRRGRGRHEHYGRRGRGGRGGRGGWGSDWFN